MMFWLLATAFGALRGAVAVDTSVPVFDPDATAGAGPSWDKELGKVDSLRGLVADLRTSAPSAKIFIGEGHGQALNGIMIAEVVAGAAQRGPFEFHREGRVRPHEHEALESELAQRDPHALDSIKTIVAFQNKDADMMEGVDRLVDAIVAGKVQTRVMDFRNPARPDMTRFINQKSFAIASLGMNHAICRATGVGQNLSCDAIGPAGDAGRLEWRKKIYGGLSPAKFAEIYDGLSKARKSGQPTILVVSSEYLAHFSRPAFHEHYNKQGLVILEGRLPLSPGGKSGNVTIVASPQMLPVLRNFFLTNGINSYLLCDGIPGCEPSARDEL